jgi:CMP-N,N'-diacetyllegionaminic acid synthase
LKTLGIIPARGGSKGVPRKNIKLLNGKPMLQYTIEAAQGSKLDRFIVSTEDAEIKKISQDLGAEVLNRPEELASDSADTAHVMAHVLQTIDYKPDVVVLLQPTSPLRNAIHINEALDVFRGGHFDSLLSVSQFYSFVWAMGIQCPYPVNYDPYGRRPRRQDKLNEFLENGAIYIFKAKEFLEKQFVLPGKLGFYVMPEEVSREVDTPFDFWICEKILEENDPDNR